MLIKVYPLYISLLTWIFSFRIFTKILTFYNVFYACYISQASYPSYLENFNNILSLLKIIKPFLYGTNFYGPNFYGTNFYGTNFYGTNFYGTNFSTTSCYSFPLRPKQTPTTHSSSILGLRKRQNFTFLIIKTEITTMALETQINSYFRRTSRIAKRDY